MRVTITKDDGLDEVFEGVTDYYIAVRQTTWRTDGTHAYPTDTVRSYSHANNLREVVKEVTQSLVELQDILREQRNGGSS